MGIERKLWVAGYRVNGGRARENSYFYFWLTLSFFYFSLCSVSLYYRIGMYSPTWGLLAWKGGIIANPFKVLQEGTKLGNKAHSKVLSFFTFPSSGFGIILLGIYEIEYGAHLVMSFEGSMPSIQKARGKNRIMN